MYKEIASYSISYLLAVTLRDLRHGLMLTLYKVHPRAIRARDHCISRSQISV